MDLTEVQITALAEIGKLGSDNAADSLTNMMKKKISSSAPEVEIMQIKDVSNLFKEEDEPLTAVYFDVFGDMNATLAAVFSRDDSLNIIDLMMDKPFGYTQFIGDMGQSVIKEIGNILMSSYLSALSNTLRLKVNLSLPKMAFNLPATEDMLNFSSTKSNHVLVIKSTLVAQTLASKGTLFFILDEDSLELIYSKI